MQHYTLDVFKQISIKSNYNKRMNYLAHFALSYPDPDLMMGNFLADLLHLDESCRLKPAIQEGITMHRKIDAFTDRHTHVLKSKELIENGYRRYSGILLDIFYDYLLSKHWHLFYQTPKRDLIRHSYKILSSYDDYTNPRAKKFASLLENEDLLHAYGDLEGVRVALKRIDFRMKKSCDLHKGIEELLRNYERIEENFLLFYPHLKDFVTTLSLNQ